MSITIIQQLLKLDLPKCEKNVLVALASHLHEKSPQVGAWPSNRTLQAESGWGERSVQNAIRNGKDWGIVKRIGWKKFPGVYMPVYTVHPESGTIHPYFLEPRSGSPPQADLPVRAGGADGASPPASGAEGTASQNGSPRTSCTQTTRNKSLNNKENYAEPQTYPEEKSEEHGEMTDERFRKFQKVIQGIAIKHFGHCDPLDSPIWNVLRAKYFPPHWDDGGG